ncbi:MAG: hypothetical protein LBQ30_02400 [Treponema sp.]|jgi:hypothetical protein|nr:hypothetical protein [Treponema sp.]
MKKRSFSGFSRGLLAALALAWMFTGCPTDPDQPGSPNNPDQPSQPDNPVKPDNPAQPDSPDNPDQPDTPNNPDSPDNPAQPDTPNDPDNPDHPSQPENPVLVEKTFDVNGAVVFISNLGSATTVTVHVKPASNALDASSAPFAFEYPDDVLPLVQGKNLDISLDMGNPDIAAPVINAHIIRQASIEAGAATVGITTPSNRLKYNGITMTDSDSYWMTERPYLQISNIYNKYEDGDEIMQGVKVKKYPLGSDGWSVWNGEYALSFSKDVEVENIRANKGVHHDLGLEIEKGAKLYPEAGKTWSDIAVDGRWDVNADIENAPTSEMEVSQYFDALANLGFDYRNDPDVPTLKHWVSINPDGDTARNVFGTPYPVENKNIFANGIANLLNYYTKKGKFDNIKYMTLEGNQYADGSAVPNPTNEPLVRNGRANPNYPGKLEAGVADKLGFYISGFLIMNSIVDGKTPNEYTHGGPMVNVGFLDDQDGAWGGGVKGVIVFNKKAPHNFMNSMDYYQDGGHAYLILNEVRTDGNGIGIDGVAVVDVRNVPDEQVSHIGDYLTSYSRVETLIVGNKNAIGKAKIGAEVTALPDAAGNVKAIGMEVRLGANLPVLVPGDKDIWGDINTLFHWETDPQVWMDTAKNSIASAWDGSLLALNKIQEPPRRQIPLSDMWTMDEYDNIAATFPVWKQPDLVALNSVWMEDPRMKLAAAFDRVLAKVDLADNEIRRRIVR